MKHQPKLAVLAAATSILLAACSPGAPTTSGGGTAEGTELQLLVPQYSDATRGLWEGLITDFEAQNSDITVALQVESWDNINNVVRTQVQGDQAPDILNLDSFATFANDGLLYAADEVVSAETLADFQDSFKENASLDGTQSGLPLIASARALFYNEDLLAEAGVSGPPTTWDEVLDAATKVSALGGGTYGYGMALGSEEAQAETSVWVLGGGGSWAEGGEITANTPANVEAVEFMQTMIEDGATEPNPGSQDRSPLMNVFIQGKIGMIIGLPPTVGEIEEQNPDLNYGIAAIPTKDGSPFTLGVADHLMAFNNDDGAKREAITKFLDFFYARDNYATFVTTEHFLPVTKSAADVFSDDPQLSVFVDLLPGAEFYPFTNAAWQDTQASIQTLIGQIDQGKDPQEILDEVQAAADAVE